MSAGGAVMDTRHVHPSQSGRKLFVARRPFGYGDGLDNYLDRGQLFVMQGERNDDKLVRLGFVDEYNGEAVECGVCGKEFDSDGARTGHGQLRHRRSMSDEDLADALEREHNRADESHPLHLENTTASRKG